MKKNVVMNIYKGYKCSFYKYGYFFLISNVFGWF